ncbi:MAG: pyridoxal phosphate-dependent aminotransferase [Deltaproteobacteria bacterium]|nr:MAG: pyridoxal phosphate-dependent aminotransferase [Deltaproteobacteria bacterium]
MSVCIRIQPDILNIPISERERIITACHGRERLADLASGNPDMAMPDFVVEQLRACMESGYARYTDYYGLPELRAKLSQQLKGEWRITADPETEIVITSGVQEGLYVVMRAVLHSGDQVLIPSPHYGNYYQNAIACGAKPVLVPLDEKEGFVPDLDRLEKAVTSRTRALVFCNPSNPLGVVWPREILDGLATLAIRHNLIVLVDEIYHDFVYSVQPITSIATLPGMAERTFTFGGFSKSHLMMGLRIGFVVGPSEPMIAVKNLHYCITLCPSSVAQVAALAALDCPKEQLELVFHEFRQRVEMLHRGVATIDGVSCVKPEGGFYLFPNMSRFGLSSIDLAVQLIERAGVITLPGTEFGPYGEGYLRLSVCATREQLEEGLARLAEFADNWA